MLVLTGKSCSGKDTISNELEKLGYHRIVTYTTRPMRPNEVEGETYHYITVEDFLMKHLSNFFLEVKLYNTIDGIWFYGSSIESYQTADDKTFTILTPSGLQKLYENNIDYVGFLIEVSDDEIKRRQIKRNDNEDEAKRRFEADKQDFNGVEDLIDFVTDNETKDASYVAKEIIKTYEGWC